MSPFLGPNLRPRLIGVGLLAATFVAGGIAGAAWNAVTAEVPMTARTRDLDERCDPYFGLGLTAEQRADIDAIIAEGKPLLDAFWDRYGAELRAIRDTTRVRIDQVLTPDQRVELEHRREKRRRHRDCDRDGGDKGKTN